MLNRIKSLPAAMLIMALSASSCSHSAKNEVTMHSSAAEDANYHNAHDRSTREVTIRRYFSMRYTLAATLLSPSFREALAERYKRLFFDEPPLILETTARTGFFVTMHSPNSTGYFLDDDQLWSLVLTDVNGESHRPSSIRRLSQKKRWEPFFPQVHQWSQEYLVVFDADTSAIDVDFVEKSSINLTISNADAQVRLSW